VNVLELERQLRADDRAAAPTPDRLAEVHRAGRSLRRRRRLTAAGAGASVLALVAGLAWTVGGLGDSGASDPDRYVDRPTPTPTTLTPLAERVLREVPGARRVSEHQVLIPDPGVATDMDQTLNPDRLLGEPVALPASSYTGVTLYPRGTFEDWLFLAVRRSEQAAGTGDAYPVGSFADGIHVDEGTSFLGCVASGDGSGPGGEHDPCTPTILHRTGADWYVDWGMGTDDFLKEGAGLELFGGRDNFSTGRPTTFWIGGIDGEVASADFLLADGQVVRGSVAHDTVSPGDSLIWANVPADDGAELAKVVLYGPDGQLIEDHPVRECRTPVDCEVR
jgi:hypothetical protein